MAERHRQSRGVPCFLRGRCWCPCRVVQQSSFVSALVWFCFLVFPLLRWRLALFRRPRRLRWSHSPALLSPALQSPAGGPNTSRLSNLHLTLLQMGGAIDKDYSLHPDGTVADPASIKILDSMLCGFTYDFVSVTQSLRVLQKHREEALLVCQKARAHKIIITHPLEGLIETAQVRCSLPRFVSSGVSMWLFTSSGFLAVSCCQLSCHKLNAVFFF